MRADNRTAGEGWALFEPRSGEFAQARVVAEVRLTGAAAVMEDDFT